MPPYTYKRLDHEMEEIRLMRLMPGQWDDEISCSIFHTPLAHPKYETESKSESSRLSLEHLRKGLPEGWTVLETLEGRYVFYHGDGAEDSRDQWDHPTAHFDRSLYEVQHQAPIFSEPSYEALSYAWGPTIKTRDIHIADQSATTLGIGANLAIALKHLRYLNSSRILWVDAICINQEDILERSREIQRMRNIYSFAKRTLIWLGEEADDSVHAISTIESFAHQVEYYTNGFCGDSPDGESNAWWKRDYRLPYDSRTWSCLVAFFRRPWFSRVWVLQEALLGSINAIVQCGEAFIHWTLLRKFILVLERNTTIPYELRSLLASYKPGILPGTMTNLPKLLQWSKGRKCTDPRDKVYGILGLVSPLVAQGIVIDYAMPIPEIYKSVVLRDISLSKQLTLLQHCRLTWRFDNEPSWIPNWSVDDDCKEIGFQMGGLGRYAAGRSSAHTQHNASDVLEVTGICCASVLSVGTAVGSCDPLETSQVIRGWEPERLWTKTYMHGGSLLDAFLETILEGHLLDRYPTAYNFRTLKDTRTLYQETFATDFQGSKADLGPLLEHFENMRFITTQEGYFGVTRLEVEKDDCICVLLGSNLPILLRPTTLGAFTVVGPCFVHGLMDGEALLGPLPSPWRMEVCNFPGPDWANFFVKSSSVRTLDDPRLPPLPPNWEELGRDVRDFTTSRTCFRNNATGEAMKSDPRMLPKALEARGVKLEQFRII